MQPIQIAAPSSVPVRATFVIAVLAAVATLAPRSLIAVAIPIVPPPPSALASAELVADVGAGEIDPVDADWFHADHLARLIEARRYGALEAAVAAIAPGSRYASWVPAALALAIDQVEATAVAYARLGMCGELGRMYAQLARAWPRGRALVRQVSCVVPRGGERERYAVLVADLAGALAVGDHARAIGTCGRMHELGALTATCLAAACNAGELALAEVLFAHLASRRAETAAARRACRRVGITFDRAGAAHARPLMPRVQPIELVRVHPDAPATR